jgi:signal transduction histidine kinase
MHNTSELQEVIHTVHTELLHLDISIAGGSFIAINSDIKTTLRCWGAGGTADTTEEINIPLYKKPFCTNLINKIKKGPGFFTEEFTQKEKKDFFTFLFNHDPWQQLNAEQKKETLSSPGGYTRSCFVSKHSSIFIINHFGEIFSADDNNILQRFGKVFEQAYTRFLDLQKAESQTRESQINLAVERVRATAMAMHQTTDLDEVNKEILHQLNLLQVPGLSGVTFYLLDELGWVKAWDFSSPGNIGEQNSYTLHFDSNRHEMLGFPFKILQQTDLNYFVADYPLEKLEKAVYEFEEINPAIAKIVMEALSTGALTHQWTACCRISNGLLGIDLISPPSEDTKTIGLKIAGAFNQAYIRFLDLQKAEAQAREAKIALAVERVRARALAMFKSEEIIKVVAKLKDEVMSLDIPDVIAATIFLNQGDDQVRMWDLSSVEKVNDGFQLPFDITFKLKKSDPLLYVKRIWENPEDHFVEKQEEKDFERYVEWLRENNKVEVAGKIEAYIKQTDLKLLNHVVKKLKNGKIAIDLLNPPSAEMESILTKMGAAFDLAYTRFLDLQKAEAQTREAQIEVALERVRSASMAMHKSDDLLLVIKAVQEQITELGIKVDASNFQTYIENSRDFYIWPITTTHSYQQKLRVTYIDFGMTKKLWDAWEKGDSFVELQADAEEMQRWWKKAFEVSELSHTPQHRREIILSAPGWNTIVAREKTCGLQLHRYNLESFTEQEKNILERLATVFEQSYNRFLDLQKAEAQAKQAIKQASLDRVRGEIASMRSTADLDRITPLVWNELTTLGVPFIRCGVSIIHEETQNIEMFLSNPEGLSLAKMDLDFNSSQLTKNSITHWRVNKVFHQHWAKEEFVNWTKSLIEQGHITDNKSYQGKQSPPESLDLYFVPFTQGSLYVGSQTELSSDEIELVKSLADAFSIAYARYEDFVKLEKAKAAIEETLSELKATQKQLIQSEKMASLGELTAGIAHEIQNPLNFVNNFSEVSGELVDELNEELEKGDLEEVKFISADLKQNLQKINHHGQRASSIVKGMLEHSRKSSGTKELTDINALADEYLRLAYHGLRAKDKDFNAEMLTDFDANLPKIEVIPQDIGRVLLNLINNAFQAVSEEGERRKQQDDLDYKPLVSVKTKLTANSQVLIAIKDNGPGIPDEIKDKIFQPFFTTKDTGKGTGLGLSLAYDIVKAHGGEIVVECVENRGSCFNITLPN